MMKNVGILSVSIAAAALVGCASTPAPVEELASARATVERAQQQAARYAPSQLLSAQEKLTRAEAAFKREDYDMARRLAQQAEVDAKLAASIAESSQARQSLAEVQQGINALKQELSRGSR